MRESRAQRGYTEFLGEKREFHSILPFIIWACSCSQVQINISDGVFSEGQQCFKIETPTATYLYQKEAGGFSNIYDSQGTDWVQFHKSAEASYPASAAADYRGLPNLVFGSDDEGAGHPGFDKMTSEQISHNQIRSVSNSGTWQWSWTFYRDFAELSVEKIDPDHAYWFLYEGPVAGKFSPATHYWGNDVAGPLTNTPDHYRGPEYHGHWRTAYFGDSGYPQVFFVQQMEQDTLKDHFSYLGNTEQGIESDDGMVVFGFGRAPGATPLLNRPHKFRIGFYSVRVMDQRAHDGVLNYIANLK